MSLSRVPRLAPCHALRLYPRPIMISLVLVLTSCYSASHFRTWVLRASTGHTEHECPPRTLSPPSRGNELCSANPPGERVWSNGSPINPRGPNLECAARLTLHRAPSSNRRVSVIPVRPGEVWRVPCRMIANLSGSPQPSTPKHPYRPCNQIVP